MREGSAEPAWVAARRDFSRAWIRVSMGAPASTVGAITGHPKSLVHVCHCARSAESRSAIDGLFEADGCANEGPASRLIAAQARANFFDQFFNFFGLLERGERE